MSKRQWEKKKEEEEDRTTYKKKVKAKAIQQQPPQIQKTLDCSPAFPGPTSTRYGVAYPIAKFLNKCQTDHISRWHQDDETQKKKKRSELRNEQCPVGSRGERHGLGSDGQGIDLTGDDPVNQ